MLNSKNFDASNDDFIKAITMNDRLNQFLRRNLEGTKRAKVVKGRSGEPRLASMALKDQMDVKGKNAYGNSNSTLGVMHTDNGIDSKNSKLLNMYFSDNIKNSHRPNKLKLNMKKMSSAGLMKNRVNQFSRGAIWNADVTNMNNWMTNKNVEYVSKHASPSERRPFTDVHAHRKLDGLRQRNLDSQSQERGYQNTKKLSKLFKKAGSGRFSQNIGSIKEQPVECGQLYAWGTSKDGVLGHDLIQEDNSDLKIDENGCLVCTAPKPVDYFVKLWIKIWKMSAGAGHIVALANNLKIYSWGCNRLGQLGLNIKHESVSKPHEITSLRGKNISSVHWGAGHSFALDMYGSTYSWGASADYQTGHSQNEVDIYCPKRIDFDSMGGHKIKDIACGIRHTLMLTTENEVISFGGTEYGQCGQGLSSQIPGRRVHQKKPSVIPTLEGKIITNIYWGGSHSICITSNQAVYSFGLNSSGQLGLGDSVHHISFPEKIRQFTSFSILDVACGDEMTMFLTSNNDVFSCGWKEAQYFTSIENPNLYYPLKLDNDMLFGSRSSVISNVYCSDKTVIFRMNNNKMYEWGSVIGQDKNKSQKPTLIKDLDYDIVDVICARAQMFVTANERIEPKNIRKNDQIMQILNSNQLFYTQKPQDRQITFYENSFKQKDLKKILHEKKKALEEEREKRMQMRDEIFKPVYCRKFHVKRSWLKSEDVSRTTNNKEPLKEFVDQNIPNLKEEKIREKAEVQVEPVSIPPADIPEIKKTVINLPKPKPKTASAVHHKPQKSLKTKYKEKTALIRLEKSRREEPELQNLRPETLNTVDEIKWERHEKLCNELTDMYESELKQIYVIFA